MRKKKDNFYFNNLNECIECSYEAAKFLEQTVNNYNYETIQTVITKMHEIEQGGDAKKHEMMEVLNKAFITPVEREDLVALSDILDDITDAIEEVLLQIYMCNIQVIRDDINYSVEILLECISCLRQVINEFSNFKSSSAIKDQIIRVNDFEEQGDELYQSSMYNLYKEGDVKSIITWKKIYECIEKCFDTCEHTADIVRTVIMKNT